MTTKFEEGAIYVVPKKSLSLDELIEVAHYYLQFLPVVQVDIKTTMLLENQRIKYYPTTEQEYTKFIEEAKLV